MMKSIIAGHGMESVLHSLLAIVYQAGDEPYLKRLEGDLKTAYDNYRKRNIETGTDE